jgi:hypothetical protein
MSNRQSITLNLPYDLTAAEWKKVSEVFRSMDGWINDSAQQSWYGVEGDPRFIWASVEPSGLLLEGEIELGLWIGWLTVLCARLSLSLNREVCDAEM